AWNHRFSHLGVEAWSCVVGLAQKRRPPGQLANDRCGTPRADEVPSAAVAGQTKWAPRTGRASARALVVRGAVAGRSGLPQRLVALRHIVQASSRSLRRVGGLPSAAPAVTAPIVAFVVPPHAGRGRRPFRSGIWLLQVFAPSSLHSR